MNEDSLLRAADTITLLASATMGGSCTHLDQSWDWLSAQRRNDLCVEASSPILLFFILGGEPFHDGLGEPGAGKSTFLLELARYLVEQAEADATKPLPILLPLSSWAEHKRPLNEWLGEEMARLYDVPPRLSQQCIQTEQALPLLDGLDEMEEANRPACIAAINAYHREHLQPLVVCSRTSENDAATRHEQLALHTAVVVQPLSPGQVDTYLATLGEPLTKLRDALETNTLLQELATTPQLLQVLLLTYHGTSTRGLSQNEAQVQEQIWTDYVQRMVRDKGDGKRYPLPPRHSWLAQMVGV